MTPYDQDQDPDPNEFQEYSPIEKAVWGLIIFTLLYLIWHIIRYFVRN